MTKFSSFKKQQKLFESWRRYTNESFRSYDAGYQLTEEEGEEPMGEEPDDNESLTPPEKEAAKKKIDLQVVQGLKKQGYPVKEPVDVNEDEWPPKGVKLPPMPPGFDPRKGLDKGVRGMPKTFAAAKKNLANHAESSEFGKPVGYYMEIIEKAIDEYSEKGHEKYRSTSRGIEVHKVTWEDFWDDLTAGYIHDGHLEKRRPASDGLCCKANETNLLI